jgi:septum formation topological specificity factor MinE
LPLSSRLEREERLADTNLRIFVPGIIGLDTIVRELNDLEPGLVKQLRKDLVTEIKPLYTIIKRNIESSKPFLSGFDHDGSKGLRRNPVRVTGKAVTTRRKYNRTSLVSIRTTSAAVQIADMAGRRGPRGYSEKGRQLIANLTSRHGSASRFIYPSIENELPRVRASMLKIIEKYTDMVNRKLIVRNSDF